MLYIVEEHVYLYVKLGVAVGFGSSSSINGLDEMLGCEYLPLSRVCSIKDRTLEFCCIVYKEKALLNVRHLIFIKPSR